MSFNLLFFVRWFNPIFIVDDFAGLRNPLNTPVELNNESVFAV